jgi:hypothetical protein
MVELAGPLSAVLVVSGRAAGAHRGLLGMSTAGTRRRCWWRWGWRWCPAAGHRQHQETLEQTLGALPVAARGMCGGAGGGHGRAMVARLLGSWMSAALLVGVAVGLACIRAGQREQSGWAWAPR